MILHSKDKHYLVETKHIDVRYKNSEKPPAKVCVAHATGQNLTTSALQAVLRVYKNSVMYYNSLA